MHAYIATDKDTYISESHFSPLDFQGKSESSIPTYKGKIYMDASTYPYIKHWHDLGSFCAAE